MHNRQIELYSKLISEGKTDIEATKAIESLNPNELAPPEILEDCILEIKERKHYEKKTAEYMLKLREPRKSIALGKMQLRNVALKKLMEMCRIDTLVENIEKVYTEQNAHVFDYLLDFFAGESEDQHKGTLLIGKVGVGKSYLHRAFTTNPKRCYQVVSCKQIANEYKELGVSVIRKYSSLHRPSNPYFYLYQDEIGWCFDDLGDEDITKNFGDGKDVMIEILSAIYDQPRIWNGFHASTNLLPEQIEARYGERIRSRMRAMFHREVFDDTAVDLRK